MKRRAGSTSTRQGLLRCDNNCMSTHILNASTWNSKPPVNSGTTSMSVVQGLEAEKQRYAQDATALEQEQRQFASNIQALEELRGRLSRAQLRRLREGGGEVGLALGRAQSSYEHCLQREAEWPQGQTQREQLITERTLYSDLVQMFGKNGIQAIIIENAIPELEEEANQIIRVSDNAMHLTLETERDTRSGNVAETLDIKISDTLGTRNYEMFSGGEASRINFALRIASRRCWHAAPGHAYAPW